MNDAILRLVLCPRSQDEAGIAHVPWSEPPVTPAHWWVGGAGLGLIVLSMLMRVIA